MISKRANEIPPFLVMDILERAQELERQGKDVIHLEVGEPDFDTPPKITAAAHEALKAGKTHYTHSLGILPLREEIANHYDKKYNVHVTPEQVIVTMGTSPALHMILATMLNPGDEVIMADPCYACYPNFVSFVGGTPVRIPVYAENNFSMNGKEIAQKISSRTKAILINSPSNPTGSLLTPDEMQSIADLGITVISDEIYHGLVYEQREHSILEFTKNAIVINGFSKYYAMTGWRLGYILAPLEYVRPIQKIQQNLYICASSFAQWAAVAALTGEHPELKIMVEKYDRRRRFLAKALNNMGLKIESTPGGAFYLFADARGYTDNSFEFCRQMLEETFVATTAGIDFGCNGEGMVRFSYANNIENIERAVDRLEKWLRHK